MPTDVRLCDIFNLSETSLLSILAMQCMLVYMYILLFVCLHVLHISYMLRGPYGRLNMSRS